MCTICGHFAHDGRRSSDDIYEMMKMMEHRGPDTHGVYLDGAAARSQEIDELIGALGKPSRIALGHSRLGIVGGELTPNTTQPYLSCDKKLALIHNGEIYNYAKLKSLLLRSHDITTTSDSEIIVHLLEETYQGDLLDAVRKVGGLLDGMYALAVTDGESLVVARDPVGKKPVYFVHNEGVTYFASERKALWNGVDDPVRLMPGDLLLLDDASFRVHEGHRLGLPQIDVVDFRQAVEMYKEALLAAVRKRLTGVVDSRLGVIFSGGIDSVLVSKLLQREGRDIVCYCTGTADSSDIEAARSVAEDLGLELKTTIIGKEMVRAILPEVVRNVEESGLLQVEVAIPMYMAAKMAGEDGIRVLFTGQAADELFAGYPWYNDVVAEHGFLRLHEKLWEDLNLLYRDTLEREDKLAMAHSIELRAPYLDRDVIYTAMRIAPQLKIEGAHDQMRKRVHRQAALELGVPDHLAYRGKDPAQSGSGIHGIIEEIAREETGAIDSELVDENTRRDKGSLYRYGDPEYGDPKARFYLQQIEERNMQEYIPVLLRQA